MKRVSKFTIFTLIESMVYVGALNLIVEYARGTMRIIISSFSIMTIVLLIWFLFYYFD